MGRKRDVGATGQTAGWRHLVAGSLCLALTSIGLSATRGTAATTDSVLGAWQVITSYDTQFVSIHGPVLKSGKVLLMGGSENNPDNNAAGRLYAEVWDPRAGTMTQVPPTYDVFCAGHSFLADGRVLVGGGTLAYPPTPPLSRSTRDRRKR